MSALPAGSALVAKLASNQPKARGFLHIVRHGAGSKRLLHRDVSPAGQSRGAPESHAGGRRAGADRFAGKDRRGFPAAGSARGAGRHLAAGFGEYSRFVAERRRDAGKGSGRDLVSKIFQIREAEGERFRPFLFCGASIVTAARDTTTERGVCWTGRSQRGRKDGRAAGGRGRKWGRVARGGGTWRRDSPQVGQDSDRTTSARTQRPRSSHCGLTH